MLKSIDTIENYLFITSKKHIFCRIEKLERKLEKPKHFFNDPAYEKSLELTQDNVEDALKVGIEAYKRKSASNGKR